MMNVLNKLQKLYLTCQERGWFAALSAVIIFAVVILLTFSPLNMTLGMEFLMAAMVLIVLNLGANKELWRTVPSLLLCVGAIGLLVLSGKLGQTGFNAPVGHALKFVDLLLVHVLAILVTACQPKLRQLVIRLFLGILAVCAAISLYYVIFEDAYAIRYYEDRGFLYVLDFNQLYAVSMLVPVVVCYWFSTGKNWKQAVWYLLFLIPTVVCVALSLYTTALLLMALGCGLAFLFSQFYRNRKRFWIIMGILGAILLICVLFRQQVSDLLYWLTEDLNFLVQARIRAVIDILFGTEHENWYAPNRRDQLAGYSLSSFLANPAFGVGYAGYGYGVIGAHQEWQDMLGVFGLVGTHVFVLVMLNMTVQTFQNAKTLADKGCMLVALGLLVVLGFLNPCLNAVILAIVYVVAPNMSALSLGGTEQERNMK